MASTGFYWDKSPKAETNLLVWLTEKNCKTKRDFVSAEVPGFCLLRETNSQSEA